jgi:hypothetical protein
MAVGALAGPVSAEERKPSEPVRAMYFGNSFLENSVPWFQPSMFATAGGKLELTTRLGPGWQVWMHVDTFLTQPQNTKDILAKGDWNAVLIQHFGSHPLLKDNVRDHVWHNQQPWPEPRDVSDFASCAFIIDELLKARPNDGRAFIYVSWPGIPGVGEFQKRVQDETQASLEAKGLDREAILKQVKERKATLAELTPLMEKYDYRAVWLAAYEPNVEVPYTSKNAHSRDYSYKLMELLKGRFPKLWAEKRLAQIPNGDVFLALDEKMRAGKFPGVTNIGFFSRDGGHIRAGLPRYTVAATVSAVMFGEHPGKLDPALYNDLENHRNEKLGRLPGVIGPGYIHWPDLGELFEITPERKKIVDDTVWEVVNGHPYTRVGTAK